MSIHRPVFRPIFRPIARAVHESISGGASFSHSFLSSIPADWTYTRIGSQTFIDFEGLLRTETVTDQPVHVGARRVENLASGLSTQSITVDSGSDYAVTIAGDSGATATLSNAATGVLTADGTNRISHNSGTPVNASSTTLTITVSGTLTELLVEGVAGQANQNPSDFIDGVRYYEYENGNTVDGSGVVTEAHGADITGLEGVLLEPAGTNLVLHSRDFTDAVWAATNITPLNDAVGFDGKPNAASTLTATAANGTIFQTVTSASADRSFGFDVKRKTGTGTIEITVDGGTTYTDITADINSSTYSQVISKQSAVANPVTGFRVATSGDEIEVDYAQLESYTYLSSRIETEAATVTRSATTLNRSWAFPANGISCHVKCRPQFAYDEKNTESVIASLAYAAGVSDYLRVVFFAPDDRLQLQKQTLVEGASYAVTGIGALNYAKLDELNIRFNTVASVMGLWVNAGSRRGGGGVSDWQTPLDTITLGSKSGGAGAAHMTVSEIAVWNTAKSDAFLEALT